MHSAFSAFSFHVNNINLKPKGKKLKTWQFPISKKLKMSIDERLNTKNITPELINYIVEKIVREIQPEKIILFGSYARGDFGQDSDLDLFIIKEGKESSRIMRRKVEAILWGRRFPVDLLVRKPDEVEWNFRAKNPFYLYHIFKDGKVLYEKE
ncbi:MAG TPA: nucleotidyltransferase domain-containing protein [Desulfobacteraceae bacterium]|nr:nucleotidyltransferase domain-containing protein [Desulfobacteraceae bacterium]